MDFMEIAARSAGAFLVLMILCRVLGKKQVVKDVDYAVLEPNGQLSVLKKVEQQNVTKKDLKLPTESPRNLPTEIIVDGKIIANNLTELHLSEAWLNQQLQKQGITHVKEVFYAEVQSDGRLYIEKKENSVH